MGVGLPIAHGSHHEFLRGDSMRTFVEVTDTFGGEANGCWVRDTILRQKKKIPCSKLLGVRVHHFWRIKCLIKG
jgi:hypothetical protein